MSQLSAIPGTSIGSAEWSVESIPLVVFPRRGQNQNAERAASLRACADRYLPRVGNMLFRGFQVHRDQDFERFARGFGRSVEPLPAESIWSEAGSGRLWVACTGSPDAGDETLIVDNRELSASLPSSLRTRLSRGGLSDIRGLLRHAACPPMTGDRGLTGRAMDANSAPLEPELIAEIVSAFEESASAVPWEPGDVLLVDLALSTLRIPAGQCRYLRFASDRVRAFSRVS